MPSGETIELFHIRRLSITPAISLPERLSDVKGLDVVLIEASIKTTSKPFTSDKRSGKEIAGVIDSRLM